MSIKIKMVILGIVAMTGLLIAAADPVDVPEADTPAWQDSTGAWTYRDPLGDEGQEGMLCLEIISPESGGKSFGIVTRPMVNPTLGLFPDATHRTQCTANRIRTGPNTWQGTYIGYGITGRPGETVYFAIATRTETILEDGNTMKIVGHALIYSGREDPDYVTPWGEAIPLHDQDTDPRDGWPDADEEPIFEVDFTKTAHRIPILPPPVPPAE